MTNAQRLKLIYDTKKDIFTAQFLRNTWQIKGDTFKVTVKRIVDKGLLLRLGKGLYAATKDYSIYELANTLVAPSYISFNTALFYHGLSFQVTDQVESAASYSHSRVLDGRTYVYRKLKNKLLFDTLGLTSNKQLSIASPERAVADCYYVGLKPSIDQMDKLNPERFKELYSLYPKSIQAKIKKLL